MSSVPPSHEVVVVAFQTFARHFAQEIGNVLNPPAQAVHPGNASMTGAHDRRSLRADLERVHTELQIIGGDVTFCRKHVQACADHIVNNQRQERRTDG